MNDRNNFQNFAEHMATGVIQIFLDANWPILYGNEHFYCAIGYDKEEFLSRYGGLKNIILPEDRAHATRLVEDILSEKQNSFEIGIQTKSAETKYIKLFVSKAEDYDVEEYPLYNVIVMDVTENRALQKSLEMEQERYRIIAEISNEMNYEYDIETDTIYFARRFKQASANEGVIPNFSRFCKEQGRMHPDDEYIAEEVLTDFDDCQSIYNEVRIRIGGKDYEWYGLYHTVVRDINGEAKKIVGRLCNIHKQKQHVDSLIKLSQTDPMTKLLNKKVMEYSIRDYLQNCDENQINAMVVVDVDNFKTVNDTKGHLFGDAVLIQIAKCLHKVADDCDLVGRMGGDEFMLFYPNIMNEMDATQKANLVCQKVNEMSQKHHWEGIVSVSVGMITQVGNSMKYEDMYKKADVALYESKHLGKNRMTIYENLHELENPQN